MRGQACEYTGERALRVRGRRGVRGVRVMGVGRGMRLTEEPESSSRWRRSADSKVHTKGLGMHSHVLMALISGGEEYMRVLKIVNLMLELQVEHVNAGQTNKSPF